MSFEYKTSSRYQKKIRNVFFNSNFTLYGQKFIWNNEMRLSTINESADVFLLKDQNKIIRIGKLYKEISPNQIELFRRLENSELTEKFIDFIDDYIDNEKRFKINFMIFGSAFMLVGR